MELDETMIAAKRDAVRVLTSLVDDWTPDRTLSRSEIEAVAYAVGAQPHGHATAARVADATRERFLSDRGPLMSSNTGRADDR